jgi:hypothetical protein
MSARTRERELDPDALHSRPPGVPPPGYDSGDAQVFPSRMSEIVDLIDNEEFTDLEMINRLIAREIAITLTDDSLRFNPKTTADKVKALRELTKTLQEGDQITKKDFLNFDGPKFKFVLGELVMLFRNSMKTGGLPEDVSNHVLRIFRDQLQGRAADLRKETDRINGDSLLPEMLVSAPLAITPDQGQTP